MLESFFYTLMYQNTPNLSTTLAQQLLQGSDPNVAPNAFLYSSIASTLLCIYACNPILTKTPPPGNLSFTFYKLYTSSNFYVFISFLLK